MDTRIAVTERSPGHGTIAVTVALDHSALDALGGESGFARQLDVKDLTASGWVLDGPSPTPGSGAQVTLSHPFKSDAEASQLLAAVAGSGPPARRPFGLTLNRDRSFWSVRNSISGDVDLSCGLDCFGDPGLQAALGHPNGVDTAQQLAGQRANDVFHFTVSVRLPGAIRSSDADSRVGQWLNWRVALGSKTHISAVSKARNTGNLVLIGAVLALAAATGTAVIIRRRKAGRRGAHARKRRHGSSSQGDSDEGDSDGAAGEAVTAES